MLRVYCFIASKKNSKLSSSLASLSFSVCILYPSLFPFKPSNTSPVEIISVVHSYPPAAVALKSKFLQIYGFVLAFY